MKAKAFFLRTGEWLTFESVAIARAVILIMREDVQLYSADNDFVGYFHHQHGWIL